jgi:hypothetical protein
MAFSPSKMENLGRGKWYQECRAESEETESSSKLKIWDPKCSTGPLASDCEEAVLELFSTVES